MDINETLNQIIFKYHLDRYYPHYRNMYEAEKILRHIIGEIITNNRKVIFVGNDETGIDFINNIAKGYADIGFLCFAYIDGETNQLEAVNWREYEEVYLVSFHETECFEKWFRLHSIRCQWIYDIFEREGVFLQKEFWAFGTANSHFLTQHVINRWGIYAGSVQKELYYQQSKYSNTNQDQEKRIALEKCLFLTLYMRNFIAAQRYVSLLIEDDKQYRRMWQEIQELLADIKNILGSRNQNDIVLYWLDAIQYGEEKDMSYLQRVMRQSVVFENAFTYVPYTKPTLRTLFLGTKEIDDKGFYISRITKEHSPVMQFLKEQGYAIKVISGDFNSMFPIQCQPDRFVVNAMLPCSEKLWNMLSDMISNNQKTLYIVHALDAHEPFFSSYMNEDNCADAHTRCSLARKELDEQLAFYDEFVCNDAYKIYMSDHGKEPIYKYHVLFNVYHRALEPRRIDGMFSLLDFNTILKQLITNGCIEEKVFLREYVEMGNCDRYNRAEIEALFQNKGAISLFSFGYKGVIDKEYIYIHYQMGKEWLQKREGTLLCEPLLFYDFENDVCDPSLIMKYRELAGEYPADLIESEKFKYAKYVYLLYRNMKNHNSMGERVAIINRMLQDYPESSVAVRTGGVTASVLYYVLSRENKEKIFGFIDNNNYCLCSKSHLPVIHSEQMNGTGLSTLGIKAIIMPSYSFRQRFREESKQISKNIDVLDIYDYFARHGIECREDLYKVRGADEDYDVGFPFEEVK